MTAQSLLARRIIPCLDVRDGKVVKGVRFREHEIVGDILDLALRYRDEGADELVLYDIAASPDGRSVDKSWISRIARVIDIPFCVAGGIHDVETGRMVLNNGADKISVNSPALRHPPLIGELAGEFGRQAIVVGIDSMETTDGYRVQMLTGRTETTTGANRETLDWVREVQKLGAGEIVLNCMNQDGVRQGYDLHHLSQVREVCSVPLIASGGAGEIGHFVDVFRLANVDGALAASVFHKGIVRIHELKSSLKEAGIEVRV